MGTSSAAPHWNDPTSVLLILLVSGHLLADFFFQTRWMVEHKSSSRRALAWHALEVALVQTACVAWFVRGPLELLLCALIGVSHFWIDAAKIRLETRWPDRKLSCFAADQFLHGAVLVLVARLWPTPGEPIAAFTVFAQATAVVSVFAFNVHGGSAIVLALLHRVRVDEPESPELGGSGAGWLIGVLERLLIVALVWANQLGAVGLVLTAKSVARFKRLDDQPFAEAYLIGTMSSALVALASGALLRWVL